MNAISKAFEYEKHEVRVVGTPESPLFVAKDVCRVLGIGDTSVAVRRLDDDEKFFATVPTRGGPQKLLLITEPGLYRLVLESRTATAYAFKRWAVEVMRALADDGKPLWMLTLEKLLESTRTDNSLPGSVYFVRGAAGHIKIGFSSDVPKRIEALQCSSPEPLELLATMPGNMAIERALHSRFERARVAGEWFRPTDELLSFIESLGGSSGVA